MHVDVLGQICPLLVLGYCVDVFLWRDEISMAMLSNKANSNTLLSICEP